MITQNRIRTLLRKTEGKLISARSVMQILQLNKIASLELLAHLEVQGFIERSEVYVEYWIMTVRGKVLAYRIFPKQYKVDTLKKHLDHLLERVPIVNASTKFPLCITFVKIISQYPIEEPSKGIYIAYSLKRKPITDEEYDAAADKLRIQYQGNFGNILEYYEYPHTAIKNFLKSRSKVLKLREYTVDTLKKLEGYLVWEEE